MRIGNFELGEEVSRSGTATLYRIAADTRATGPRVVKCLAGHAFWTAPQRHARVRAFLSAVLAQKTAAAAGGNWAPVYADGLPTAQAFYVTRPYACSAAVLCSPAAPAIRVPALHRIIGKVLAGLVELRSAAGRPHGRLTPNNVLLDRPHSRRPTVVLSDPAPDVGPGSESLNWQADLRAVGELICQLVLHAPVARESVVPADDPAWEALGTTGRAWRTFAARLLGGADAFDGPEEARRAVPRLPAPPAARFAAAAILLAASAMASYFYVHPPGGRAFDRHEWTTLCDRYAQLAGPDRNSLADDPKLAPLLGKLRSYDPRKIIDRTSPPGCEDTHTALRFIDGVLDPALQRRAKELADEFETLAAASRKSYGDNGLTLATAIEKANPLDPKDPLIKRVAAARNALRVLRETASDLQLIDASVTTLAQARDPLAELVRDETARLVASHDADQVGKWARRIEAIGIATKLQSHGYDVEGFEKKWRLLYPNAGKAAAGVLDLWSISIEPYRYLSKEEDPRGALEDELGRARARIHQLPPDSAVSALAMQNWQKATQLIAISRRDLPNPIQLDADALKTLGWIERHNISDIIQKYGQPPSNQQELDLWVKTFPRPSDDDAINRAWAVASKEVPANGHPIGDQYDLLMKVHGRLVGLSAEFRKVDSAVPFPESDWQSDAAIRCSVVKTALEKPPLDALPGFAFSSFDSLAHDAVESYKRWRTRMKTALAGAIGLKRAVEELYDPDDPLPIDPHEPNPPSFAVVYEAWKKDLEQANIDDRAIFKEVDRNAEAVITAAQSPAENIATRSSRPLAALAAAWKRSTLLPSTEAQIERQLTEYVTNLQPVARRDVLLQQIASVREKRLKEWLGRPSVLSSAGAFPGPEDVVRSARDIIQVPFHVDPNHLPATCQYNLALLGLREKLANSDPSKRDDVRNWRQLADLVRAGENEELRGKLVNVVAMAKGILSPGHKDSDFPGPEFAGWKRRDGSPGQILFQSPAPDPVTLEFWRIDQKSQTYLCATVVSIRTFRAVATELDESELKGLKARLADDGVGKPGACALDYVNDKWVAREKWFVPTQPEPVEPDKSYKGVPPDGPPTLEHPVPLVSARLAKSWSNRLKCRLPTIKEWTAALEGEQKDGGRGVPQWNVKDKSLSNYRAELQWNWLKRFPRDKDLFPPNASPFMSELRQIEIDKRCTNPTYNDRHVFIEPVQPEKNDGAGNVGVHYFHLIGNVAQFVTETPGGDHVCVIGGSAFWTNPSYTTPYEVPPNKLDDGWIDVGFRLAFDEGAPIREQLRALVAGANYIDAPATVLPR